MTRKKKKKKKKRKKKKKKKKKKRKNKKKNINSRRYCLIISDRLSMLHQYFFIVSNLFPSSPSKGILNSNRSL